MIYKLIDSHTHIQFEDFDVDREKVIERAFEIGVGMINIGTDEIYSEKAVKLARQYPDGIYASVGIHPNETVLKENIDWDLIKELARDKKVIGIGECGLDYLRVTEEKLRKKQKQVFLKQIELAKEINKPLIIHCRNAHEDLLRILQDYGQGISGVMHFFGGNDGWDKANEYLNLGFYLSFSGVVTFQNYDHLENLKRIPLEKILVETDAPFATPVPYRGKRNEPFYVIETAKKIAEIKGIAFEEFCKIIIKNTETLFSLSS